MSKIDTFIVLNLCDIFNNSHIMYNINMEGLPKLNLDNKIEKTEIKKGVDFVFEQNPQLTQIGSKEQYSEYLDTIFPESKTKGIVYHQTPNDFSDFDVSKSRTGGIYFSPFNRPTFSLNNIHKGRLKDYTKAVVININNPFIISSKKNKNMERGVTDLKWLSKRVDLSKYDGVMGYSNTLYDKGDIDDEIFNVDNVTKSNIELSVLNNNQIHTLGSNQDIEKFRKFSENHKE